MRVALETKSHHPTVDGIDALLRRDDHVEDEEMPFETIRDVVFARTRVVHRAHELQVFDNLCTARISSRRVVPLY